MVSIMKISYVHNLIAFLTLLLMALTATAQVGPDTRPMSTNGLAVFEAPKGDLAAFNGLEVYWGAAFTQQFQALDHENAGGVPLVELGNGFNLATANLNMGAHLAKGITVAVESYWSSLHHPEAWVKGGYLQVNSMEMLGIDAIDQLFEYMTVRAGHFEINYGDAHFRRTDNGNALFNPFVGNLIMDSFATEIGMDVTIQNNGFFGVVGVTNGEIKGAITRPDDRALAYIGKLGVDRQLNDDLRVRLSGSVYTTSASLNNTLYAGDRAGSRYYDVMVENAGDDFRNGRMNPGFRSEVTAFQVNPMIIFQGFELHGVYERATGAAAAETDTRSVDQMAVDAIYRMNDVYVGLRYNTVSGEFGYPSDVTVNRVQAGAGWFLTPNVLLKAIYSQQTYEDFPVGSIQEDGKFNGFTVEGVVAF